MKKCQRCGEEMELVGEPGETPYYACDCSEDDFKECVTCLKDVKKVDENFECVECAEKAKEEDSLGGQYYDDLN